MALRFRGKNEEAETNYRLALAMKEKTLGAGNPSVAHTLTNLAEVLERLGKKDEASKARRRAAAIQR